MSYIKCRAIIGILAVSSLLLGCSTGPVHKQTNNSIIEVQNPPFNYTELMGFQPVLPSQNFGLKRIDAYVFKFVNPPWGKVDPQTIETWGNDTAFDSTYMASNGTGKSFAIIETKMDGNGLPNTGHPWNSLQINGRTFYQTDVPGYGTGIAVVDKGVLYVAASYNGLNIEQLEQVLQSLTVPIGTAPDLIKTQTFGVGKARTSVPFTARMPKTLPFTLKLRTAEGVDVKTYRGKDQQDIGRLTLTYTDGKTDLKVIEAIGMKFVNPNISKAQNGTKVTLSGGASAVFIDGGEAVSFVDGGSPDRKVITWNTEDGVNMVIVGSKNVTQDNLIKVADSLSVSH